MKSSYAIYFLTAATLFSLNVTANEEKPKISICNNEEHSLIEDEVKHMLEHSRSHVEQLVRSNAIVMKNFDQFAEQIDHAYHREKSITAAEVRSICEAVNFAADKHRLQTRKNKEKTPYISHPIGVAYNLLNVGKVRDSNVIVGALLHDTVEDTQTTFEEIEQKFGKVVTNYVREVTDNKTLTKEMRKRMQVISAASKSKGAAMIKLADKLYNVNDLLNSPPEDWSQSRVDIYFQWAQSVIDRLPEANSDLRNAAERVINTYWEKQKAEVK